MSATIRRAGPAVIVAVAGTALLAAAAGSLAAIDPGLGILAALTMAFVLVAFADLRVGILLFTVVAFLSPGTLVAHLIAAVVVLALAWLARITTGAGRSQDLIFLSQPALSVSIVLLLAWSALSISWSGDPALAIDDVWRYTLNIALVVIVYTAVRRPQDAWWVAGGFIAGGVVTSLHGFVIPPETGADPTQRFGGGLGDPNVLAVLLVTGAAFAAAAAGAAGRRSAVASLAIAGGALCLLGFMLTASRGGLIALAAALIAAIIVGGRWRLRIGVAAVLVASSIATYMLVFSSEEARERLGQTTTGEIRVEESRFTTWEIAGRMANENPLLGVGVGNFEASSIDYLLQPGTLGRTDHIVDTPLAAHNTYLHYAAELGIPGVALFLVVVAFSIGTAVHAAVRFRAARNEPMEMLSRAVVVAMVAMLTASVFISMQTNNKLWLLLALGPALLGVARREAGGDRPAT